MSSTLTIGSLTGLLRADSGVVSTDSDVTDLVSPASTTAAGKIEIADQSEMETGTDTTLAVCPGNQHFHPTAAKFWADVAGAGTGSNAAYNVSSIGDYPRQRSLLE